MPPRSHSHRPLAWLALLTATLLGGCAQADDGLRGREVDFAGSRYHVVTIDLARHPLTLHWRMPDGASAFGDIETLRAWGERHHRQLLFAANAGIYDRRGAPLGLYVEAGRVLVPLNTAHGNPESGNFSLLPNGTFMVGTDGKARVLTTAAFATGQPKPRLATQSGPMLVVDGHINPHFVADSSSIKWRSGVCAPTPDTAVFAISESPVNFHSFARLFLERLGCRNALYLDGTISQMYDRGAYFGAPTFMVRPYAGIFAVFDGGQPERQPAHSHTP